MDKYLFQYCPKLVVFSTDGQSVLLAKRRGEADYDGTYSLIGGKLETSDRSIEEGLQREKSEEIGTECRIRVALQMTHALRFEKADGSVMIMPHHYAEFVDESIMINPDEYSEYAWIALDELEAFEPKIPTIPEMVRAAQRVKPLLTQADFILL